MRMGRFIFDMMCNVSAVEWFRMSAEEMRHSQWFLVADR